jgi:hypothetical protein
MSLHLLGSFDEWALVREEDDIATFSRGAGTEFFVRAEMILKSSMFPVMALFSECDLFDKWITQIKEIEMIGEPTNFRKLVYYTCNLPTPLTNRDVAIIA